MSVRHHKALKWERSLKDVFDQIDVELEDKFGGTYPLHPARARRGKTSNPAHDGLFTVGAAFSAGFGSTHGRGYIVRLRLSTLKNVPKDLIEDIEEYVVQRLREELPKAFPNRELKVTRDGPVFKIHGDLSLGSV